MPKTLKLKGKRVKVVLKMKTVEDSIIGPADGLAGALAQVGLALAGYSQAVAHMPINWRRQKKLN
jgi:hypothetical protein